jgi:hypothetical protein
VVGRIVDRAHPRPIIGFGFSALAIALTWLSIEMTPDTPIWRLVLPFGVMGIGMAFIWSPLAATATRHQASDLAGAGSGVYNATRQVGSVLGSASMAAFMTSRISAEMPSGGAAPRGEGAATALPESLQAPFAAAMSQSLLLSAFVALIGVVAAIFLRGSGEYPAPEAREGRTEPADDGHDSFDDSFDEDEYLEYTVSWDDLQFTEPITRQADESVTAPLVSHGPHGAARPEPPPGDDPWRRVLDELLPEAPPVNGRRRRYRDDGDGEPDWLHAAAEQPRGRHARGD